MNIAIIGGGPAGISLAYLLSREVRNAKITIYEKTNRIGGQSEYKMYDNILYELGTIYLDIGYTSIIQLCRKMGLTLELMQQRNLYVNKNGLVQLIRPALSTFFFGFIHLLYWIQWKLTNQDVNPSSDYNQIVFSEFIKQYNVSTDDPTIQGVTTGQLYGPATEINVYNAFQWYKPSNLITGVLLSGYVIKEGFEELWKRLLICSGAQVVYNKEITTVMSVKFDHIFITVPLDSLEHPLKDQLGKFDDSHILSFVVDIEKYPHTTSIVYGFAFPKIKYVNNITRFPCVENYNNIPPSKTQRLLVLARSKKDDHENINELITACKNELQYFGDFGQVGEVLDYRFYRYNVRYSDEQLKNKIPQLIQQAQGINNIWYSGGALSHWNVNSIFNSNVYLVQNFIQKTSNSWFKSIYVKLLPMKYRCCSL